MKKFTDKTALITGGAAGIGKLMGHMLLEKGLKHLVIWDINTENAQKTIQEFSADNFSVSHYIVDVSNTEQVLEAAQKVKANEGKIDLLINNAGVVVGKYFHEHQHQHIDFTMSVNTSALMHIALEFLPDMIDANQGYIVNIASAAGMVSNPKMAVYAASKWAVIGWSDSLRLEMLQLGKKIQVTTVTPYYIATGMFAGVKSRIIPILRPEKAAKKIIRGIEKNKAFVRMPGWIYILPFVKGILPLRLFDLIVGKGFGVYNTMKHFTGHQNK